MSRLIIDIDGIRFTAVWHDDKAPTTCQALRTVLPLSGHVLQARWSGEAVWFPMPQVALDLAWENQTCYPSKGELLYYPGFISVKEILIPYGACIFGSKAGVLPGNHFASITEGFEALAALGEKVLWEGAKPTTLRREA